MLGQPKAREASDAGAAVAKAMPAPRLLVIDDDALHRLIICRAAARAGYVPAQAASCEEAVELAQATAFDCITLDLSLGAHAGVEMLRRLQTIGCKAPIIIVSGSDSATCRAALRIARTLKLDVVEWLAKPVDLATLRYSLERIRHRRLLVRGLATVVAR